MFAISPKKRGGGGTGSPKRTPVHRLLGTYHCQDCGSHTDLHEKDYLQCKQCGAKILYKIRPDVYIDYAAR